MGYQGVHLGNDAVLLGERWKGDRQTADVVETQAGLAGAVIKLNKLRTADRVVISNTLKAHELLHLAKAQGRQAEMKERLLRAYWTEGRRLGRIDELVVLAAEGGLERDAAQQALETGAYCGAVRADMAQAAQYGIRGVPFFVLNDKYGLSGAQEPETLLQALTTVAGEERKAG